MNVPTPDVGDFEAVARVIASRRTSMLVDTERDVDDDVLDDLFRLAAWAPCHKRTWPWRFCKVRGDSRGRLGSVVATAMERSGDPTPKVDKARTKYLRTPVVLVIGSVVGDTPNRTVENRDATAAAVQNLMLAASARGLATYWGSCPTGASDDVARFAGFDDGTSIVGLFYLGWATSSPEAPERPAPIVTRRD